MFLFFTKDFFKLLFQYLVTFLKVQNLFYLKFFKLLISIFILFCFFLFGGYVFIVGQCNASFWGYF